MYEFWGNTNFQTIAYIIFTIETQYQKDVASFHIDLLEPYEIVIFVGQKQFNVNVKGLN